MYIGWEESWFWRGPKLTDFLPDSTINASALWNSTSQLDPATVAGCSTLNSPSTESAPLGVQLSCQLEALGQPVAHQPIGPTSDWSGPGGGGLADDGEVLRMFHPTAAGHRAIYASLRKAITEVQKSSPFLDPT